MARFQLNLTNDSKMTSCIRPGRVGKPPAAASAARHAAGLSLVVIVPCQRTAKA